jgi:hypothetical protein
MSGLHANTAEVLRMLAASPQVELFSSLTDDAIRFVLKLAAEACERFDEAEQERDLAAMHAAEWRSLLDRVAIVLDAQPSPAEGGTWEAYTLAEEVRRARAVEPPAAGHRLRQERLAARRCIRTATALVVALRQRDMARVRACIEVFDQAHQAYEAGWFEDRNVNLWPQGSVSSLDLSTHSDPHGRPHSGDRSPGKAPKRDAVAKW